MKTLCPECRGNGAVQYQNPQFINSRTGWAGYRPCKTCGGKGKVESQ